MTPYILAIGALAWALAWARRLDRLAGDQTVKTDKERQKRKTKDFSKSSTTPNKHGSRCATQPRKIQLKEGRTIHNDTRRKDKRDT